MVMTLSELNTRKIRVKAICKKVNWNNILEARRSERNIVEHPK